MTDALLQTKLHIPPTRPNLVPRPRLMERLRQSLEVGQRLTLVSAPAGFGKTTVVAEWLHQVGRPVAWLTLDERENDPARFLAYILAALKQVDPEIGESVTAMASLPQPPAPESLLTILINELSDLAEPFVMAVDDYHAIQSPAVHTLLSFLIENQPPKMHLAVMTREDPPLPVARWRARGQVNELRQDDLRFTGAEVAYFLKEVMALDLASDEIAALETRTEGWIAGLQLAGLSMRGQADRSAFVRSFAGSSRFILDFLIEEVFDRQTAAVQTFLLQTAILDRLCAPLCDAVTGRTDGQEMLVELERANLFLLPADQSRTWHRYHRLFAEFLRHRLRLLGEPPEDHLHRRAGRWLEAEGHIEEALGHMLAAGDWVEAERLVGQLAVVATRRGQLLTLQNWLEAFPAKMVANNHSLTALKAFGLMLAGRLEEAGNYADRALELMPADAESFDKGFLAALRSYLVMAQGDIANALVLAREALHHLEEDDPYFLRGAILTSLAQALTQAGDLTGAAEAYRQVIALSQQAGQPLFAAGPTGSLAWLLNLQGKRIEAVELGQELLALCLSRRGKPMPVSAIGHMILGLLHLEADEIEPARTHLLEGLALGDLMGVASGIPHSSRIALARLQLAVGEQEAALATIEEARLIVAQYRSAPILFTVAGAEADLRLRLGDMAAVEHFIEQFGLSPAGVPAHASESAYFTHTRLLLAQSKLDEAGMLLTNLEQFATDGGRRRSLITVQILKALLHQAQGDEDSALDRLAAAVQLAAPEGYRRAFLDEGQAIFALLPRVSHVAPAFVYQLLEAAPVESGRRAPASKGQPLIEPLSHRELEILQLIAAGYSNREIAEQLFITVGTVKTHAHNIYGKLNANGRTQAVARARELALL